MNLNCMVSAYSSGHSIATLVISQWQTCLFLDLLLVMLAHTSGHPVAVLAVSQWQASSFLNRCSVAAAYSSGHSFAALVVSQWQACSFLNLRSVGSAYNPGYSIAVSAVSQWQPRSILDLHCAVLAYNPGQSIADFSHFSVAGILISKLMSCGIRVRDAGMLTRSQWHLGDIGGGISRRQWRIKGPCPLREMLYLMGRLVLTRCYIRHHTPNPKDWLELGRLLTSRRSYPYITSISKRVHVSLESL